MFVRFVVGTRDENPYYLTGVFTAARILMDDGALYDYESDLLKETFAWFNSTLPCPPFQEMLRQGEWSEDCVAWFRDDAKDALRRIWDIIALLKHHDVPVRLVTSPNPGNIVYSDEYQVVAETSHWA